MKRFILSMILSIVSILFLSFATSLIFSLIQYNKGVIINNLLVKAISIFIFFIGGFIFGLSNKKQGLIGSITFILVYFITLLIINGFSLINSSDFIVVIIKMLVYLIACILSVNIKIK